MTLAITLFTICAVLMLAIQYSARPRQHIDRISGSKYRYSAGLVFVMFLVVAFISAHRYGFCDTGLYRDICGDMGTDYDYAYADGLPFEDRGFNLLMIFLNNCGFEPQSIIIFCAYVVFSVFFYTLYKYSSDLPFSLFLIIFLSYYTMINGIRQVLAAAILLLGLPFLRDKKFLFYVPLVWLAYTMHASAMIMVPLYFVLTRKRLNMGIWAFYSVVLLFFVAPSLAESLMGDLLKDSVYSEYMDIDDQMNITRLLVAAIPLILTLFYCKTIDRKAKPSPNSPEYMSYKLTNLLINMQFISFGFTVLGLRMVYFARLSMYFEITNALLLPIAIRGSFDRESAKTVKRIAILLYFIYFLYQTYTYNNYLYFNDFRLVF